MSQIVNDTDDIKLAIQYLHILNVKLLAEDRILIYQDIKELIERLETGDKDEGYMDTKYEDLKGGDK